uniref:Uncharacterized protein n=1 Tax=Amazona collaria TaxID=241587 RepID=A0A8B9IUV7_9PSIT
RAFSFLCTRVLLSHYDSQRKLWDSSPFSKMSLMMMNEKKGKRKLYEEDLIFSSTHMEQGSDFQLLHPEPPGIPPGSQATPPESQKMEGSPNDSQLSGKLGPARSGEQNALAT